MGPPNRTTDTSVLVRLHSWQKDALEQARRKAEAALPPGQRLSLNDFILGAAMDRARDLGVEPEKK